MSVLELCCNRKISRALTIQSVIFQGSLRTPKGNNSTIDKEILALLLALKHFDVYLNTTAEPVLVYTDHNPIVFINKMKGENQRLLQWSLISQQYKVQINHIKGRENIIADALSRAK